MIYVIIWISLCVGFVLGALYRLTKTNDKLIDCEEKLHDLKEQYDAGKVEKIS